MMILVIRVLLCAYLLVLLTIFFGVSTIMKYIAIFAMFAATYAL